MNIELSLRQIQTTSKGSKSSPQSDSGFTTSTEHSLSLQNSADPATMFSPRLSGMESIFSPRLESTDTVPTDYADSIPELNLEEQDLCSIFSPRFAPVQKTVGFQQPIFSPRIVPVRIEEKSILAFIFSPRVEALDFVEPIFNLILPATSSPRIAAASPYSLFSPRLNHSPKNFKSLLEALCQEEPFFKPTDAPEYLETLRSPRYAHVKVTDVQFDPSPPFRLPPAARRVKSSTPRLVQAN